MSLNMTGDNKAAPKTRSRSGTFVKSKKSEHKISITNSNPEEAKKSENVNLQSSSTAIPEFLKPTSSSHWATITWGDVKAECMELINAVDATLNDVLLTTPVYRRLQELKKALQTSIRRRNRIPDEVWLCYRELQRVHQDALNGNYTEQDRQRRAQSASAISFSTTPGESRQSLANRPRSAVSFNGDMPMNMSQQAVACWDSLSSTLVRCGIELELYDEETNGLNRVAGVGLGIAVVFAICTVVYYF